MSDIDVAVAAARAAWHHGLGDQGQHDNAALVAAVELGRRQAAEAIRAAGEQDVPDGRAVLLEREHAARIAEGSVSDV